MTTRATTTLLAALALAGCATAPPPLPAAETRQLTSGEKTALAASLPRDFKDPTGAQFRWLQIIVRAGTDPIGYCAMVNGKNAYGAYTGFRAFFALVTRDAGGR